MLSQRDGAQYSKRCGLKLVLNSRVARSDEIALECLRDEIRNPSARLVNPMGMSKSLNALDLGRGISFYDDISRFEGELFKRALELTSGHQGKAAKLLVMNNTACSLRLFSCGAQLITCIADIKTALDSRCRAN